MNIHTTQCPICGNTSFDSAISCVDHYATKERFEIQKCTNCGFLFTQDFPCEEEIGRYYDTKEYISHSNTNKGLINKLYHLVRRQMLKKKADLVRLHTHSSSVWLMDFGCGTGFFLSEMAKRGWAVKGIEKNEKARTFANKSFGVSVLPPDKMKEFEEMTFAAITSWHSLEHIENLNETLKLMHKLLVENGTAFIAVPNANAADAERYKEYWAAYDVPRHLWHFTPDTMKKVAEKNGFGIDTFYPMPFDAFYISLLSEKYKKSKLGFIRGMISGVICYIKTIRHPEKSSSILYVLKKSETLNFRV